MTLQKATAQTVESILVQRRSQARLVEPSEVFGCFACPLLSQGGLIKTTPSSFHLPPVSMPTTTSLHRPEAAISGYVASLSRLAGSMCSISHRHFAYDLVASGFTTLNK